MKENINVIKFKNKTSLISGIGMSGTDMVAVFRKTGNKYFYSMADYFDFCRKEIGQLADIGSMLVEKRIRDEIRRSREQNGEQGIIRKLPKYIRFKANTETDTFTSERISQYNDMLNWFMSKWTNTLYNTENDDLPEPVEILLCDNLSNMAFTQQMQDLQFLDYGKSYVKINVPCEICSQMYFYTNHEMDGETEIWRKAFDPFIWSGIKI